MSRQRYSILPAQNEQGVWVYLFRDNDASSPKGGKLDYGVACHYDGEKRNFTKTLDAVEAIEICGDLNEQEAERAEEVAKEEALTRMALSIDKEMRRNHIPPLRTGSGWGFWPFNR
jgi:hypothetical protein